jgi:hypothetical protein
MKAYRLPSQKADELNTETQSMDALASTIETSASDVIVASLETLYTEGDVVQYDSDQHIGVVTEVYTEDFTIGEDDTEYEASSNSPSYVVALEEGGYDIYSASDLDQIPEEDAFKRDMSEDKMMKAMADEMGSGIDCDADLTDVAVATLDATAGWDDYPDSWEEADRPARVILLDAWTSMNASFDGCVREMRTSMSSPQRFCASMKDEVYGGYTGWRNGGDD